MRRNVYEFPRGDTLGSADYKFPRGDPLGCADYFYIRMYVPDLISSGPEVGGKLEIDGDEEDSIQPVGDKNVRRQSVGPRKFEFENRFLRSPDPDNIFPA